MNKVVKILVIVAIVIGVAGVWGIKNKPLGEEKEVSQEKQVQAIDSTQIEMKEQEIDSKNVIEEKNPEENKEESTTKEEPKKELPIKEVEEVKKDVPVKSVEEPRQEEVIVSPEPEDANDMAEPSTDLATEPQNEVVQVEEVVSKIVTPDLVATEFDLEKLKSYKLPIMIEFGASWCTWCRWMEPTLEELNKEYAGRVVIQSVDVEKFWNEVSGFDVSLLPTIYFFDADGNVFETRVGAMVKEDIVKVFESMGVKND